VSAANRPIPNNRFLFFANISSLSRSKTNTQKGEFRYAQKGKHAWKLAAKKSGHGNFIKKKRCAEQGHDHVPKVKGDHTKQKQEHPPDALRKREEQGKEI